MPKTSPVRKVKKGPSRTMLPTFIVPQLAKLVERPPATPGWAHEVKFDGYRAQLRVQAGEARIRTRRGLDWTEDFAAIARIAQGLPDCIIDGEICALDHERVPSFAALQAATSMSPFSKFTIEGALIECSMKDAAAPADAAS